MMELGLLPPLVAFEINLLLGIFALVRLKGNPLRIYFASFAFCAALWCLGGVLYFIFPGDTRELTLRLGFMGGVAIPVIHAAYCRYLMGDPLKKPAWLWLFFVFFAVNIIANFTLLFPGRFIRHGAFVQGSAVFLYFASLYLWAFIVVRPRLIPKKNDPEHVQARFIFLGTMVPFALMFAYSLIAYVATDLPRPNVLLPVVIGAELMLYYWVRFKKIEVDELLSRGLLYLIYTVVLTGILFLVLFGASKIFILTLDTSEFLVLIGLCLASAYAFIASRDRVETWIDRTFFPQKYEYQKMILLYEEELKDAREKLYNAERLAMLGELSTRIAHEIKNPLGPIKGYTQMLIEQKAKGEMTDETLDKALTIIADEVEKIDERVKGFLDLARKERPAREDVDVHKLIESTLALLEVRSGIKIVREFKADRHVARLSASQFQGALYNIFINAAQAMAGKGTIEVATANHGDSLRIDIRDTGPGIPDDLLPRIFEPFQSGRPGGTGLGLAIVKSIVEAHEGRIEAESKDGRGASFHISIPATEAKKVIKSNFK